MTVAFVPATSSPGRRSGFARAVGGRLGMLIHATSLLVSQRFVGEAVTLQGSRVTILPPPCPIRVPPTDFSHAEELMARRAVRRRGDRAPLGWMTVEGRLDNPRPVRCER